MKNSKKNSARFSLASGSPLQTREDHDFNGSLSKFFDGCGLSTIDKLQSFPVFARRQDIAKFLCRYEIFRESLATHGSVIEVGTFLGAGLLSFAKFSAIMEPTNNSRRFYGFDTFTGFPALSKKDVSREFGAQQAKASSRLKNTAGVDGLEFSLKAASLFDKNRFLPQVPKIEFIKGDVALTVPKFMREHAEMVISLLYIDVNLYEPVKKSLPIFWERMPKGAVIAFDELNAPQYPGETLAVVETIGLGKLRLKRGPYSSYVSYAVKE